MDIKTLYYLANFEHDYESFRQSLDEFFKIEGKKAKYKLTISSENKGLLKNFKAQNEKT